MAKYKLTLNQPNLPQGFPEEVPPVGIVENGSTVDVELTPEQAEALSNAYGVTLESSGEEPEVTPEAPKTAEEGGDKE